MRKSRFNTSLLALMLLASAPVYALDYLDNWVPAAQKVGAGRLTYLFWDIYDATLYAPQGVWRNHQPFALQLVYLKSFEGRQIADRSLEEMRAQGLQDEMKLAAWHKQMRNIFPDVEKGVSLTGIYTQNGETVFYRNTVEIGRIKDPEFSQAFFAIWLGENTSEPDMRRQLLGA